MKKTLILSLLVLFFIVFTGCNNSGNIGSTDSNIGKDITPPDTIITSQPEELTNTSDASFKFSSTKENSSFECKINTESWESCDSPKKYSNLNDKKNTFKVRAKDTAGNIDDSPASYTWTIDTTPPNTTITSHPQELTNLTTATFKFSSSEDNSTFKCRINNGNWKTCTTPKTYTGLPDKSNLFEVKAIDQAGNIDETPTSYTWTISGHFNNISVTHIHICGVREDGTLWCWGDNFSGQLGDGTNVSRLIPTQENTGSINWQSISTGNYHTCGIKTDGTIYCWGYNGYGQLGDNTTTDRYTPVQEYSASTNWESVSAGANHTCGVKTDGTLWCWGYNGQGRLGDNTTTDRYTPVQEYSASTNWESVSVGESHTCGVKTDGTLWCWGKNNFGQFGDNTTTDRYTPVQEYSASTNWQSVSAGYYHTCGIKTDGTLWCWGYNNHGQLGDNTINNKHIPTQEKTGSTHWKSVSTGQNHSCGTRADNTLYCWGDNSYGELGIEGLAEKHFPSQENSLTTDWQSVSVGQLNTCGVKINGDIYCWGDNRYKQLTTNPKKEAPNVPNNIYGWNFIESGNQYSCGITSNGTLHCWGKNDNGQLGDGTKLKKEYPVSVSGNYANWISVSTRNSHTCGVKTDGTLYCWGYNNHGQLGDNTKTDRNYPEKITFTVSNGIYMESSGSNHSCEVKTNGTLYCWGDNGNGQLGNNSTNNSKIPVQEFSQSTNWVSVSAGDSHTCGIKKDGTLWCWGDNTFGKIGDHTSTEKHVPTQEFTASTNWESVSASKNHTCGVKTDGTLWCWGCNYNGEIGDNTVVIRYTPTQEFSQSTNWASVSAGNSHTCGIKKDGTLWCWGDNYYGQLGDNTTIDRKSPVLEYNQSTNWKSVSAGDYHTCGVKTDGTLYCWGNNSNGQIGDNTTTAKHVPTQENTASTNWLSISAYSSNTCGLKTDGTLWCWGYNHYGQLGDNTITDKHIPTQEITVSNNWKSVSAGYRHTGGVKTDGTLWCWGYNLNGQLGDNTTLDRHSPTIIDTQEVLWKSISVGTYYTCGISDIENLYCWGYNGYGQLGDNSINESKFPVQEIKKFSWNFLSVGYMHTCAVKTDGTLWCWGYNGYGQLGDNTTVNRDTPTQENSGSTNWQSVSAGYSHTCGLKTDGTLWCWGDNNFGQLGDNTTINRLSPVQENSLSTNWKSVSTSYSHTCGVKTDGTLWCWGDNWSGQLGDNTTANKSIPTQENTASTNWLSVSADGSHTCGIKTDGSLYCWGDYTFGQLGYNMTWYETPEWIWK